MIQTYGCNQFDAMIGYNSASVTKDMQQLGSGWHEVEFSSSPWVYSYPPKKDIP